MSWAVLGHTIDVSTFDGDRQLEVPAGCQPEETITLDGLGVTHLQSKGERGDLVVHINVLIPTKLNDRERELIGEFAQLHDAKRRPSRRIPSRRRHRRRDSSAS